MTNFQNIDFLFKFSCIILTIGFVVSWIYTYALDEDTTTIEMRSYFSSQDDPLPVMSMCFEETFDNVDFTQFGENITRDGYINHLKGGEAKFLPGGHHFDKRMTRINYDAISINISNFWLTSEVYYYNGTSLRNIKTNVSFKYPYHSYTASQWRFLNKCFALEVTDPNVKQLIVSMKRDIFPGKIRNPGGGFTLLFHYPNQVVWSYRTLMRGFPVRDNTSNFQMDVKINGMAAHVHRYKPKINNCITDWKNYDSIILQNHFDDLGCKAAFYGKKYNGTICITGAQNKLAPFHFENENKGIPPCRGINNIEYTVSEEIRRDFGNNGVRVKVAPVKDWFQISLKVRNPEYQAIIQKKAVDMQSLIGYIGGYIGMFTGFAIAQAPTVFLDISQILFKIYK